RGGRSIFGIWWGGFCDRGMMGDRLVWGKICKKIEMRIRNGKVGGRWWVKRVVCVKNGGGMGEVAIKKDGGMRIEW
ncbi:hypothetical protein, partial [Bacillus pumilus]|uniref:hypothetical protein n=1 Tax=Bacillus pumilus TaxID=1408 RepID=UPI001C92DD19